MPQKLYEILRWLVSVVLPAISAFITSMNMLWNWGLPIEAIAGTFSAVETFLGSIFLFAKYKNDKR